MTTVNLFLFVPLPSQALLCFALQFPGPSTAHQLACTVMFLPTAPMSDPNLSCVTYSSTLKMEAVSPSKMSLNLYQTRWHHTVDANIHSQNCETLLSFAFQRILQPVTRINPLVPNDVYIIRTTQIKYTY